MDENKIVKTENVSGENNSSRFSGKKSFFILAAVGFVVAAVAVIVYVYLNQNRIYVEKSQILADPVNLSSNYGGELRKMLVNPGDMVFEDQVVAQVGKELVKTAESGIVISTNDNIGKNFSSNETVVSMIRPRDLRVVAQVEEDKGLSDIKIGQAAFFTVDAFGSKKFEGIVDEISPTYREGDVVFNISSQREVNEFNVKIRFDTDKYPELKNGMSAKSWIFKD